MEKETPQQIMERLAKTNLYVRFNVKDAFFDHFIKRFATKAVFGLFGLIPKNSPVKNPLADYMDFEPYILEIPIDLLEVLSREKPLLQFPNSDEWMHWLRDNLPEGMALEDFESIAYNNNVFCQKWADRYLKECRIFGGIRLACAILVPVLHLLIGYMLFMTVYHHQIFSFGIVSVLVFFALFISAKVTSIKK